MNKPATYTMRYSRLFSLGNFENEKIDIERSFTSDTDSVDALKSLISEVNGVRNRVKLQEQQMLRYQQLQEKISFGEKHLEDYQAEMAELEKELQIRPVASGGSNEKLSLVQEANQHE